MNHWYEAHPNTRIYLRSLNKNNKNRVLFKLWYFNSTLTLTGTIMELIFGQFQCIAVSISKNRVPENDISNSSKNSKSSDFKV